MTYVDGFVMAVPAANKDAFIAHAQKAREVFQELGVIGGAECWGDDVPPGKRTSFPQAVQKNEDEVVVFGWLVWPSKEVRDVAMAKMMDDPRMSQTANPMPFDGQRMIYGGFEHLIDYAQAAPSQAV